MYAVAYYLSYLKITFDNSCFFADRLCRAEYRALSVIHVRTYHATRRSSTSLRYTPLAHALCERERPQTPPSHREARAGGARDYWTLYVQNVRTSADLVSSILTWISGFQSGFLDFKVDFWISKWISGFQVGFLDFRLDFRISEWISGFQSGFLDFKVDFWISEWISGFLDFRLDFWISNWISADGVRDFSRDGPLGAHRAAKS